MPFVGPRTSTGVALALVVAGTAGCMRSASYPFRRDLVWRVAMTEATVWHPTLIDDDNRRVISEKTDLAGTELKYETKVEHDLNPFAPRPSTRVYVRMAQVKPQRRSFADLERQFLRKVAAILEAAARASRSQGE